jgi:hypothetical protein
MTAPTPPLPELPPDTPGDLLDRILEPLLDDFAGSFERGFVLLAHCPDTVLNAEAQQSFRERLELARAELAAARALRAAAPTSMALDMATITPWHQLVLEVWSLSASLRALGITP